jgi:hypothetical protein
VIINYRWSASRQQDSRLIGSSVNRTPYAFPQLGQVPVPVVMAPLVTVAGVIQAPVNCVVAGQQPEQKKATPLTGVPSWARGIFGE